MYFETIYTKKDELYHHGIQGQKWGVRHGPPYPLSQGARSPEERNKNDNTQYGLVAELAVTAAMVGIELAVVAAANHDASSTATAEMAMLYKEREFDTVNDIPKIKGNATTAENLKVVNPDYPKDGTVVNCTSCTTAMVMREKGYDVKATSMGCGAEVGTIERFFDDAHFADLDFKSKESMSKGIAATQGEGAYGNLLISWPDGGGHSVMYKVENGETIIYDGQIGLREPLTSYAGGSFNNKVQVCQLNNKNPSNKVCAVLQSKNSEYKEPKSYKELKSFKKTNKDEYKSERKDYKTASKENSDYNKQLRKELSNLKKRQNKSK